MPFAGVSHANLIPGARPMPRYFRTPEYPRPYPDSAPLALDRPEVAFLDGGFDQQAKNDFRTPEYPRPYPNSAPPALNRAEVVFLAGGFDQHAKKRFSHSGG